MSGVVSECFSPREKGVEAGELVGGVHPYSGTYLDQEG